MPERNDTRSFGAEAPPAGPSGPATGTPPRPPVNLDRPLARPGSDGGLAPDPMAQPTITQEQLPPSSAPVSGPTPAGLGPPTAGLRPGPTGPVQAPAPVVQSLLSDPEAAMQLSGSPVLSFDTPPGDTSLSEGQMVDEYQILGMLGEGGMGTVYAGIQPVIGKRVAIKVLLHEFAANVKVVSRFVQEARAVNQIRSRYIVDIFSFGKLKDGRPYFVMEYLDGTPLRQFIRERGVLRFEEAFQILQCVARGLSAAHGGEIVHRDLKPENIIVIREEDGELSAKILDFGIAKLLGGGATPGVATQTGIAMGTPYYMSPEQVRGAGVDHRADIYALGIIMFEMFTGALPFVANSYIELVTQHLTAPPPNPRDLSQAIPHSLEQLILRCIAKDPADRPQTMAEFLEALNAVAREARGASFPQPAERGVVGAAAVSARTPEVKGGAGPAPAQASPRKSRTGLWIAIVLLVLLVGGGGGGVVYYLQSQGPEGRGSADPVAGPNGREPRNSGSASVKGAKAASKRAELAVELAYLKVDTQPEGASVTLDGHLLPGLTSLMVPLDPGTHRVSVTLDGHAPVEKTVEVLPGKVASLDLKLVSSPAASPDAAKGTGRLKVRTGQEQAVYFVDGQEAGRGSTLELSGLTPGSHQLKVEAPGRKSEERTLDIEAGALVDLSVELAEVSTAAAYKGSKIVKAVKGSKGQKTGSNSNDGKTEKGAKPDKPEKPDDPDQTLDPFSRRKRAP